MKKKKWTESLQYNNTQKQKIQKKISLFSYKFQKTLYF